MQTVRLGYFSVEYRVNVVLAATNQLRSQLADLLVLLLDLLDQHLRLSVCSLRLLPATTYPQQLIQLLHQFLNALTLQAYLLAD